MKALIVACLVFTLAGAGFAQDGKVTSAPVPMVQTLAVQTLAAPTLSELNQVKIENGLLKMQAAQAALDKTKADFQTFIATLQKPGFQIVQGADGKFVYQPEPKK